MKHVLIAFTCIALLCTSIRPAQAVQCDDVLAFTPADWESLGLLRFWQYAVICFSVPDPVVEKEAFLANLGIVVIADLADFVSSLPECEEKEDYAAFVPPTLPMYLLIVGQKGSSNKTDPGDA